MPINQTYSQLLEVLREKIYNKSSGTLYIHSDCNHAVNFALDRGEVYAVYYGPRRGLKALPLISQITGGTCRFEATKLSVAPQDLPSTPEILGIISEVRQKSSTTTASDLEPINSDQKGRICGELKQLLTRYLGPISDMVFEDALAENESFCTTPENAMEFVDRLSEDIEIQAEVRQFREQAGGIISKAFQPT